MTIQFLAVGRVLRPHGVRGEMLLESLTDFPERLNTVETVYLGEPPEPHPVRGVRWHRGQPLLHLSDCPDREAAERFRNQVVQIRVEQAAPPPPGVYYQHQIIGLAVVTEAGEALGAVTEVLETGANDVYVVGGPQGEILLPALRSVIREIDLEAGRMTVRLMAGMKNDEHKNDE